MAETKDPLVFNEYDTVEVFNPLKEEFIVRFNGQPYKLGSKEKKPYPFFLAFHVAKHLSDLLLQPELQKIKKEKGGNGEFNPKNAQLMVYDNPKRRMALYSILGSEKLVQGCIEAFPFKAFLGEMKDWTKFLEDQESEKVEKPKTTKKDEE